MKKAFRLILLLLAFTIACITTVKAEEQPAANAVVVQKYVVTLNPNGGSVSQTKKTIVGGGNYGALPVPTRKGYSFAGWYTAKTGGAWIKQATVYTLKTNQTLYAHWTLATYKINYVLNGGTGNTNKTTYNMKTATFTLKNVSKKGYIFKGWYTDSSYKKKITRITKGSVGNKTLYAKWTPIKYNIKFNGNGKTGGSMTNMKSLSYNKSYALKKNAFLKKGYYLAGWTLNKNGTGKVYKNMEKIINLSAKNNATVNLYAKWALLNYSITYNLNGGTNNNANPKTYNMKSATITLKNPSKRLYTFVGWYSDAKFKTKVTTIKNGSTGNKTLYAKWKKINYACTASATTSVPVKNVNTGYSDHVNWTWSTGLIYGDACKITYRSSNTSIATVNSQGTVTAKNPGTSFVYECVVDKKTNTELVCFKGKLNVVDPFDNKTVYNSRDSFVNKYVGNWYLEGYEDVFISVQKYKWYYESMDILATRFALSGEVYPSSGSYETSRNISYENWNNDLKNSNFVFNEDSIVYKVENKDFKFVREKGTVNRYSNAMFNKGLGTWYLYNHPNSTINIPLLEEVEDIAPLNNDLYYCPTYSNFNFDTFEYNSGGSLGCYRGEDDSFFTSFNITFEGENLIVTSGDKKAVFYKSPTVVDVEDIELSVDNAIIEIGKSLKINATVLPGDAYYKDLTWSSSDPSVASVEYDGTISANSLGEATITVKNENGFEKTISVSVIKYDVESISINGGNSLIKGNNLQLNVEFNPSNATYKDVTWSSSDESVATVDSNGLVKGINKGTTIITVTSNDTGVSSSKEITVLNPPLTAKDSIGYSMRCTSVENSDGTSSSWCGNGLSASINVSGGTGRYTYYDIKLYYSDGTFITENDNKTKNEVFVPNLTNGSFYMEYRVIDTDGEEASGTSGITTISYS